MRRSLLLALPLLLLSAAAIAQQTGTLTVTVVTQAEAGLPNAPAPAMGAKVIVMHWSHEGPQANLVQDRVATTNQMGTCVLNLPPGNYDIFVSASGLAPAAFQRELEAGQTGTIKASLRPAPSHLRPVQ